MNYTLRLEELREERGLSQKELANILQVNVKTIKNWEVSKKIRFIKHVVAIALFFDISTDYLFGLSDKRKHK